MKLLQVIEDINEWMGRIVGFAVVFIMFIQLTDVLLRYIFNSPLVWAWDINGELFVGSTILCGGYVLLHDGHVRVDIIYGRVSEKVRAILDFIIYPLTIFALAIISWQLFDLTLTSWQSNEHSFTYFSPPLYFIKTAVFIGAVLFLLETISRLIKAIISFKKISATEKE